MSSHSKPDGDRLTARQICILALLGTLIFATKFALSGIPNVNLNTLLIILCVVFFGWKTLYVVFVYVLLEGLVFGFSLWWFSYLYAWPTVTAVAMIFRKNESVFLWAVWLAGIPYDLIHCASNFLLILFLYKPLYRVFQHFLPKEQE